MATPQRFLQGVFTNDKTVLILFGVLYLTAGQPYNDDGNYDQFSYEDSPSQTINNVYGPEDWDRIRCVDLDECVRDDCFIVSNNWRIFNPHAFRRLTS